MVEKIPKRLTQEPLFEALWEIRFSSDQAPVSDLLPGIIYKALGSNYGKLVRLPASNIPHPIAEHDEALRYVATLRLEGNPFFIQIGERVVSLNCRRPYAGWAEFSQRIAELANVLRETALITKPERFSLKYLDLIELDQPPSLACLNVSMAVGGHDVSERPVQFRTEIAEEGLVHILQIASPAEVKIGSEMPHRGVLVSIDTIVEAEADRFWEMLNNRLNQTHKLSKRLFFRLLTEPTLAQLGPEY